MYYLTYYAGRYIYYHLDGDILQHTGGHPFLPLGYDFRYYQTINRIEAAIRLDRVMVESPTPITADTHPELFI